MLSRHALAALFVVSLPQHSSAQALPPQLKLQDQGLFTKDGSWVYMPLGEDPIVVRPPGKSPYKVPLATEGRNFGYRSVRDGYFWDIRRILAFPDGKREDHSYLYRRLEGAKTAAWERVAEIDMNSGVPNYLVPLDKDGWFLGVGPYTGFFKDGRASHVALFRLKDERLSFEELVDMPFRDRSNIGKIESVSFSKPGVPQTKAADGEPLKFQRCTVEPASLTPDLWVPCLLPDSLVLASSKLGVLWVFSLRNGQCRRVVDLGGLDAKNMDKLGLLDHFLVAAQPDRHNRLIVVTRDPEVLSFAAALATPAGVPKEVKEGNQKRFKEVMEGFRTLRWWSIDPKTGQKEEIDEPASFPARSASYAQTGRLRFLVGPDGKVHANTHMPWDSVLSQLGVDGASLPETPKPLRTTDAAASRTK